MKKSIWLLTAALLLSGTEPFFAAAQTTEERIESGRFGAEEPIAGGAGSDEASYKNRWIVLGARLGPSLRFYTPSDDTAFTGFDTYSLSMDAGLHAGIQIVPAFSIQAEAVFTWDNASKWQYALNDNKIDLDRYARTFTGLSLQFPVMAKLHFYPGKFRISPFLGGYFILPLGEMKTDSPRDEEASYSYSLSPPLGLLAGVSLGFPMGHGMIFADIRYTADLAEPELKDSGGMKTYRRRGAALSFGYEFALFKKR
jgi:hypothetical protein